MSGGPLAGVRVVDLTTVVVGPTATLYLADFGADVIKVEAPSGDLLRTIGGRSKSGQLSGKFTHFNRNKRSLALDLKEDKARGALDRLLQTADVFIANVRPAALARLGLAAPALRARYQRLLSCATSKALRRRAVSWPAGLRYDHPGYGRGCRLQRAGAGRAALCAHGICRPRGWHHCGAMHSRCPLPARADRTGTGNRGADVRKHGRLRAGRALGDRTFIPPLGESGDRRVLHPLGKPIPTKDGYICVSADTDAQAFALFDAIGRPELKCDP